jgi:hypothetical protein
MNITIFSKNRACQLDLLLRSLTNRLYNHIENPRVVIIYKAEQGFKDGYRTLIEEYGESFHFIDQDTSAQNFKDMVLLFGLNETHKYSMFLVDDDVFLRNAFLSEKYLDSYLNQSDVCAHSLRMSSNISYCYTGNFETPKPSSFKDSMWNISDGKGDWGYPASLDGNVFRTYEIKSLLKRISFSNPNSMEGQMDLHWNLPGTMMSCEKEQALVGIPANLVQTNGINRHGNQSAEFLEAAYVSGKRISMKSFEGISKLSPHVELEYILED